MLSLMLMAPALSHANVPSQAKILETKGDVTYLKPGTTDWAILDPTVILSEGDSVKTGPGAQLRMELMGSAKTAEILIRKETEFKFSKFRFDEASKVDNTLLEIGVGSVLVKAEKLMGASKFEVKTPTSIVGIRGTIFEVHVPKAE